MQQLEDKESETEQKWYDDIGMDDQDMAFIENEGFDRDLDDE